MRSYIIYFFNAMVLCIPVVCGVRSSSLLYIPVPRQAEADFSLVDLLWGGPPSRKLWREAVWSQETCLCLSVLISRMRREAFPPYPSMKGTWRGFSTGGIYYINTSCKQSTERKL